MIFTSITFVFFLIIVYILYWFVFNRNFKYQNYLLLASSYIFYGWWDWRLLLLLFAISVLNYIVAILIQKKNKKTSKKLFLIIGLVINVGTLFIFKYFNYFVAELINLMAIFDIKTTIHFLNIILPVGISFYIFLSISYLYDIYQDKVTAVRNISDILLTFSFFL